MNVDIRFINLISLYNYVLVCPECYHSKQSQSACLWFALEGGKRSDFG